MRTHLVYLLALLLTACADPADDHVASHSDHGTPLEATEPAVRSTSLYQVTSLWTDHIGETAPLDSLAGKFRLVAMTYTSCQVSCPVIVAQLKHMEQALASTGIDFGIVLLSLDPARDTPEALAAFATRSGLSERWKLLTAPADDVREMAVLLGVRYRPSQDGEFAHSNTISVLDAEGALVHQQTGLGADLTKRTVDVLREHSQDVAT